jgi:hypothetical protein
MQEIPNFTLAETVRPPEGRELVKDGFIEIAAAFMPQPCHR